MSKDIMEAIHLLDGMWGHHGEGSDLIVKDQSKMFDIIFNEVLPRLRSVNAEYALFQSWHRACVDCGMPKKDGGPCPSCNDARHKMRAIIESKIK